jgi:hypothetical protein
MKLILSLTLSSILIVSCSGPGPIEKKKLVAENPTEQILDVPHNELEQQIVSIFKNYSYINSKYYNSSLFYYNVEDFGKMFVAFHAETSDHQVFSSEYFAKPGTRDDIYLYTHEYWLSPIYYSEGEPLEYLTPFSIKLTSISETSTKIKITAEDPKVIHGTECCGPHGRYAKQISVSPTTIEEYSLILFIAEQIGVSNLKPLVTEIKK